MLRFHGSRDKQTFELVGANSRLDAVQAAMLRVFLPQLPGWNAARREAAAPSVDLKTPPPGEIELRELGSPVPAQTCIESLGLGEAVELPVDEPGHVYHMYVVRTEERERITGALAAEEIACAAYYVTPLHLQPAMAHLGYRPGSLPETERAAAENLALPMWGGIDVDRQAQVVSAVRAAAGVAVRV